MTESYGEFSSCHFLPWIGPTYESGIFGGLRTLILGESHYSWGLDPSLERNATRIVMGGELANEDQPFFGRIANVLLGSQAGSRPKDRKALWNGVAFYNYVQEYVGSRPKDRPTSQAWRGAEPAFRDVLSTLRPQLVFACGKELYDHIKSIPGMTEAPKFGADQSTRSRELLIGGGGRAIIGCVYHPASFGFRTEEWCTRVPEYVERAQMLARGSTPDPADSSI